MRAIASSDRELTTATSAAAVPVIEQPTRLTHDLLAQNVGALRSTVGVLSATVERAHTGSLALQLDARTDEAAKRRPAELLTELSEAGFSWVAVARILGVSVPAVRKWRLGESVASENRRNLARLIALVGVVATDHLIVDVASWLEMPIAGSAFTGVDVLAAGEFGLLMQFAAEHVGGQELLSRVFPAWEANRDDGFEVATAEDGSRYIRLRDEGAAS